VSLLFDQNLSWRLSKRLAVDFPNCKQIVSIGLANADDRTVWNYAASAGFAVVSKDQDFLDLALSLGPPPKFIWLRVGNGPTHEIEILLRSRKADVLTFLADPSGAILELP